MVEILCVGIKFVLLVVEERDAVSKVSPGVANRKKLSWLGVVDPWVVFSDLDSLVTKENCGVRAGGGVTNVALLNYQHGGLCH